MHLALEKVLRAKGIKMTPKTLQKLLRASGIENPD
jgi:hypothetical protein